MPEMRLRPNSGKNVTPLPDRFHEALRAVPDFRSTETTVRSRGKSLAYDSASNADKNARLLRDKDSAPLSCRKSMIIFIGFEDMNAVPGHPRLFQTTTGIHRRQNVQFVAEPST